MNRNLIALLTIWLFSVQSANADTYTFNGQTWQTNWMPMGSFAGYGATNGQVPAWNSASGPGSSGNWTPTTVQTLINPSSFTSSGEIILNNTGGVLNISTSSNVVAFRGNGLQGSFTAPSGSNTESVGTQHNFLNFTVGAGNSWTIQSKSKIMAIGAVDIEGNLFTTPKFGGPNKGGDGYAIANICASGGGGGGGNGGAGGKGGVGGALTSTDTITGGSGGGASTYDTFDSSSGGSGQTNTAGARGGGVVLITAQGTITIGAAGVINVNGFGGSTSSEGGGSGGTVGLYSQTSITNAGQVGAIGGNGGTGGAGSAGGGGAGGGGFIMFMSPSNTIGTTFVGGGTGGAAGSGSGSPGAGSNGSSGSVFNVTAFPSLPLVYLTPKLLKPYAEMANAKAGQELHLYNINQREWTSFAAAMYGDNQSFNGLCQELNSINADSPVLVGEPGENPNA